MTTPEYVEELMQEVEEAEDRVTSARAKSCIEAMMICLWESR